MPDIPNASPAARLAAVLNELSPDCEWFTMQTKNGLRVVNGEPEMESPMVFDPASKDDLARVVGMLTREQQARLNATLRATLKDGARPEPYDYITAPAEKWVEALVAAVGATAE